MKRIAEAYDIGDESISSTAEGYHVKKRRLGSHACLVCDEQKYPFHFPGTSRVFLHGHNSDVCKDCYREHVHIEIDNKVWDQIACPQCSELLNHDEVKATSSRAYFEKYDKAALMTAMSIEADFRYCMSASCKSGQLHPGGLDEPIFRCQACNSKHCVACEVPWHKDKSCEEYQRRLLQDVQNKNSEQKIKKTTKPCPECKTRIEKNNGCDHMTCSRCRHQYCWCCLANYRDILYGGNHMHGEDCSHYRPLPTKDREDSEEEDNEDDEEESDNEEGDEVANDSEDDND